MRIPTLTTTLALLLSTTTVLAETLPSPTPSTTTSDDYRAEITPFPQPQLISDENGHLEIRQVPAVAPDPEQAVGQVPPVTVYSIATQMGATGVETIVTYTQLFSAVPDQWPSAKAGTIGYGTLQHKRAVEARDTGVERIVDVEQPVVTMWEVEVVMVPVQRVVEVLVVESVVVSNFTAINSGTRPAEAQNGSAPAVLGTAAFGPLYTATAAASRALRPSGLRG